MFLLIRSQHPDTESEVGMAPSRNVKLEIYRQVEQHIALALGNVYDTRCPARMLQKHGRENSALEI
jgi:hypothetical protein